MPRWIPALHNAKELQKLYADHTVREIAAQIGCVPSAVTQALHRFGIPRRPPGQPSAPQELKDGQWLQTRYAECPSTHRIAAQLGCGQITVLKAMWSFGIIKRKPQARPIEDVVTQPYSYTTVNGEKVCAHRFLMEKHLNRKLNASEGVHHLDGNQKNNDLSNLIVLSRSDHNKLHFWLKKVGLEKR